MSHGQNDPGTSPSGDSFRDAAFEDWARGLAMIRHEPTTRARIAQWLDHHARDPADRQDWLRLLHAADHVASMGMWLVVHMTYTRRVQLDGQPLAAVDFKPSPEGHTGGALNMVIGYVGYLLANAMARRTRAWTMGQGHCVAAIDAVNVLMDNTTPAHAARYALDDAGLTRLVEDFYACRVSPDGRPVSPLGSHVNPHTAGGTAEGGYLGFTGLQYVHMPLPGQALVAFLSDGAFEEQRGSDWVPRWWRAEDCGPVVPVMIANGRRIDQRTGMNQAGGTAWFQDHLTLNGFSPLTVDGRDPAAVAWGILTAESELAERSARIRSGRARYPIRMPYVIAETIKGYGFPGAGTNAAHNLPLGANPADDSEARRRFQAGVARLHVPLGELGDAIGRLRNHAGTARPKERDHALADPRVPLPHFPAPPAFPLGDAVSPMAALDEAFLRVVEANPELRVRIGNPDEMRSNRLDRTLDRLRHRVTDPEPDVAEALDGAVITALNEEAVVNAALANKQGLNLVASYEAFAVKMLGAMRQEVIFARHAREAGRVPGWLSVPVLASSHLWENGKNEQSHQDPTLCEAWLGELEDVAPTLFPIDATSAIEALRDLYRSHARVGVMVVPKRAVPVRLTPEQARRLTRDGLLGLHEPAAPRVQLFAIGAYQLIEAEKARDRLEAAGVAAGLYALLAPGRLREPRDDAEGRVVQPATHLRRLVPGCPARVFLCHGRPEVFAGTLRPLDTGGGSRFLGYRNQGGTLDTFGMLFANRCTWAHALAAVATAAGLPPASLLTEDERRALAGQGDPEVLRDVRRPG
ncbi:xylulose 5-phosphate 3-epimerase [Halomonas organivorans]